jgi:signal transduction histidine kinase
MTMTARERIEVNALPAQNGLSRREIARRKAFLEFGAKDVRRLSALAPLARKYADEVIEELYNHFLSFAETRKFFRNKATLERVKALQKQYFLGLTGGRYDEQSIKNRLLVLALHEHIGLDVETYLGAYRRYLYLVSRRLWDEHAGRSHYDLFQSLLKLVFLDIGLAIDTYVSGREQTIQRQHKELTLRYRELQEASRVKNEFLANMSHELRTPLTSIIGFAELLHDGELGSVDSTQKDYLGDLLANARHLLELINEVLDLAKVEAGSMTFHPEPIDIAGLLAAARRTFEPIAARKRIRLRTEGSCRATPLLDPIRLKQVLFNYLSNAVKFTGRGGEVVARARREGNELVIEVEDNGIGIRKRDLPGLFVQFQQLDVGTSKKYQGTGLGLAITKHVVEAQGGSVGAKSKLGAGSTFYARLPLKHRRADGSVVQRSRAARQSGVAKSNGAGRKASLRKPADTFRHPQELGIHRI